MVFTATPRAGSRFGGWSGDCFGRSAWCVVVARGAVTATARFERRPGGSFDEVADAFVTRPVLNVTVAPGAGGVVTASKGDIACPQRCSNRYDSRTRVELRAAPKAGHRFRAWSSLLASCGRRPSCVVNMNTTTDVSATFDRIGG